MWGLSSGETLVPLPAGGENAGVHKGEMSLDPAKRLPSFMLAFDLFWCWKGVGESRPLSQNLLTASAVTANVCLLQLWVLFLGLELLLF